MLGTYRALVEDFWRPAWHPAGYASVAAYLQHRKFARRVASSITMRQPSRAGWGA